MKTNAVTGEKANVTVEVTSNREKVLESLGEQVGQALIAVGLAAETNAKDEIEKSVYQTPEGKSGYVRTGRLKNSLTHAIAPDEGAVYIGSNVEYAAFVEIGTTKMKARPYLRPAATQYTEQYKELVEMALKSED